MNANKLILLFIMLLSVVSIGNAKNVPSSSRYDQRMKHVYYNPADVTQIKSSGGYLTSLIFGKDEMIQEAYTGFFDGWHIHTSNNIAYLKPIAVKEAEVAPNSKWNTNLMVKTNKRFYVFDLEVVPDNFLNKSYVVSFEYPQNQQQIEKKKVDIELNKLQTPRNWDYRLRVKDGSQNITPNFVYDDGINTYLGYSREKSIPSPFEYDEKANQEIIVNFTMKDYNNRYKLMIINKVKPVLVLRQGKNVVGIYNKGFGKNIGEYQDTISNIIERKIIEEPL